MSLQTKKVTIPKFGLRLMPSVRRNAELVSEKEGVSLNQFINLAVAEKLAHLEHDEWVGNRKQPTKELTRRAMNFLDRAGSSSPEPGDELPEGYESIRASVQVR
jgi:hypothetical protein